MVMEPPKKVFMPPFLKLIIIDLSTSVFLLKKEAGDISISIREVRRNMQQPSENRGVQTAKSMQIIISNTEREKELMANGFVNYLAI